MSQPGPCPSLHLFSIPQHIRPVDPSLMSHSCRIGIALPFERVHAMRITEIVWSESDVAQIARHGVTSEEVEEAISTNPVWRRG